MKRILVDMGGVLADVYSRFYEIHEKETGVKLSAADVAGKLYLGNHDPEGIMSTLPAISTALPGMFTGEFLLSGYLHDKPLRKVFYMALTAIALMIT